MKNTKHIYYFLLYLPYLLSWALKSSSHTSYLIAWLGSFFIFFVCYKGIIKQLPNDIPILEQLLRPIFFLQVIFAGYMACTSIFYYANTLGYEYFSYVGNRSFLSDDIYESIAKCQRYYVLGHAALTHGLIAGMDYPQKKVYRIYAPSVSNLLLGISIICLPLGYLFSKIGALNQFSIELSGLSFVSGAIALAFAIRENKRVNLWASAGLFALNLLSALSSGFKEPIIICVLLVGIFLLPVYGKKVAPVLISVLIVLFFVLPTFIGNFRRMVSEGVDTTTARNESLDKIIQSDNLIDDLQEDNWAFLTGRLSEIDMFIRYTKSTPYFVPFYKSKTVTDAIKTILPRFFWPGKPDVEQLVMTRVYTAGVVDRQSIVSAKPAFIVDCYLSYGAIGIWIGLFLYGYIAQRISLLAEEMFGSYFMGTAVMFAGLFQIMWRGNSFEFLFNSIFWSLVTMFIFQKVFKARGILYKV
ncbi:MAG: hypothetical protein EOO20_13245 [Chryseobacterium sp.]|uniref:exosortase Y-associated Wzy-like protein n=1 Tax=Pedobacter agri TaxID=454586 RepID=UPI0012195375|nr:hypothetical protein [Pedobacter agri]MDQ1141874.1 ABC-type multidrug transport system fused ATPase/permease subunit [Pedobacter agri]RZJ88589.1 MAG: hypothetical protein EOO20_13245 [Chryseobacterium sp.]